MGSLSRVGLAAAAAVVVLLGAVALRAERLLGDAGRPSLIFDVDLPPSALEEMRARDIEAVWRARLATFGRVKTGFGQAARPDAIGVRVEVIGARAADRPVVERALTASAQVQLRPVLSDSDVAQRWYVAFDRGEVQLGGAEVHPDTWDDRYGEARVDYFVKAHDRAALDRAVATLVQVAPPPPDVEVLVERVVPAQDAEDPRPYERTYLVRTDVIIDNDDIREGLITYDPNTLRPEVAVSLTKRGAWAFGDATAAMVGDKLAIVVDGRVVSAPVVQSAIRGGRLSITPGMGTLPEQEAECQVLVAAFGTSARLPPGITARHLRTHEGSAGVVWTARLAFALVGGALAWFLPAALGRRRWFVAAPSVIGTPFAAPRWDAMLLPAGVTLALPTLLWFAAREPWLAGVNHEELEHVMALAGGGTDLATFGIFSLGVVPVISAFVLTELAAAAVGFLVPAWRARRLGTPADRRRLDLATWLLAVALAAVQAYLLADYLASMSMRGAAVVTSSNAVPLITLTLTAGVMANVVIAELISRHGLCNGYLVLSALALVPLLGGLIDAPAQPPLSPLPSTTLQAAVMVAAALATFAVVRVRAVDAEGRRARLPYTGTVPAELVRTGFALFSLPALWSPWIAETIFELQAHAKWIELGAMVPLAVLILLTARRPWTRPGLIVTAGFLALLGLLPALADERYRMMMPVAPGVTLAIVVAELVAGVHARIAIHQPTTVLVVHDVFRADEAADRLAAAGIPHAVLGVRARAALRLLGAYVPVEIRVPAIRAEEARALVA